MVMNLDSKFEKIIRGQEKYQSTMLGLNLLITRLQRKYSTNPTSEELNSCLQEMRCFFEKYSSIVVKDVEALKKI